MKICKMMSHFATLLVRSMILFHPSKLQNAKFFILCDAIFLLRLQGKLTLITLRRVNRLGSSVSVYSE